MNKFAEYIFWLIALYLIASNARNINTTVSALSKAFGANVAILQGRDALGVTQASGFKDILGAFGG